MNVIKDPHGGSELAKKIILMTAQNTVDEAEKALAAHKARQWEGLNDL